MILSNPLNPFNERKRIWRFGGRKTPKGVEDKRNIGMNCTWTNFLETQGRLSAQHTALRNKNEVFLNESLRSFLISFFNYVNNLHSQKNYFQLIRNARQKNWAEQKKWKLTIGRKAGNKIITKSLDFAVCRPKSTLIGYIKCAGWSFIESNKC